MNRPQGRPDAVPHLLERDRAFGVIDEMLRGARGDAGGLLIVEGPAGIGKSALLAHARHRAESEGMTLLGARGGELEQDFSYGVVRQLFEPALRLLPPEARASLLVGPASLAASVIGVPEARPGPSFGPSTDRSAAVLHGLYWLTVNLASERPLFIEVDDAHWSDSASLRYVLYLARRLEGLQVFTLIATRRGEPRADHALLGELASAPSTISIEPPALTAAAVAELIRTRLGQDPEEAFVAACHGSTGGVPFLVHELLAALADEGVDPTVAAASRVEGLAPSGISQATLLRLARLEPPAAEVAEAVAVLGPHATVGRVASLAGTGPEATLVAVDALTAIGLLETEDPLRFAHPILRAAVYEGVPRGRRSTAHGRAAKLLAGERAEPEQTAVHLLVGGPGGVPQPTETLRAAAAAALARGAPESAASYLRRAAELPSVDGRVEVLHELGRVEAALHDPRAADHLEEALRLAEDPVTEGRVVLDLTQLLMFGGRWDESDRLTQLSLDRLAGRDKELELELEAQRAARRSFDPRAAAELQQQLPRLHELAAGGGKAARRLSLLLAAHGSRVGEQPAAVVQLVERGLDGGRLIADEGGESWGCAEAVAALVFADELDGAERVAEAMLDDSRLRGSAFGFVAGAAHRAWVDARRGDLATAEANLRSAVELTRQQGLLFPLAAMLWYCADVVVERPQALDIAELVDAIELPPPLVGTLSTALLGEARARLELMRNRSAQAIAHLRAAGDIYRAVHAGNPVFSAWRSTLGLALADVDADEASELVSEELEAARAVGLPRAEGVALRAAGLLEGGETGLALLRESLAVLDRSPSALERARTTVELGAALRRSGRRVDARELLAAGLNLAHLCGADRLADRAEEDLRASGAKPRRRARTGLGALTPSEARVARMAAAGLSNREIAQALFVTGKTVENQLGQVYRKLGVGGRDALPEVLEIQPPGVEAKL